MAAVPLGCSRIVRRQSYRINEVSVYYLLLFDEPVVFSIPGLAVHNPASCQLAISSYLRGYLLISFERLATLPVHSLAMLNY